MVPLVAKRLSLPVQKIAAAYADGATIAELAEAHGVSRTPIRRAIAAAGIVTRRGGVMGPTDAEAAAMVEDHRSGMPIAQIAAKHGRGRNVVRRALTRAGIPLQRGGRPNPMLGREAVVAAEYADGATMSELMAKYGVSAHTVRRALVSHGVAVRPPAQRRSSAR